MANTLRYTNYFEKKLKKLIKYSPNCKKSVRSTLFLLEKNEFDVRLKTHKVTGRVVGECFSSRVTAHLRILWKRDLEAWTILDSIDIGGHSGTGKLYK
jgi:mRNA-degrading endonuclease YafQ of YafQ-DinJ toxin-antitoxin module